MAGFCPGMNLFIVVFTTKHQVDHMVTITRVVCIIKVSCGVNTWRVCYQRGFLVQFTAIVTSLYDGKEQSQYIISVFIKANKGLSLLQKNNSIEVLNLVLINVYRLTVTSSSGFLTFMEQTQGKFQKWSMTVLNLRVEKKSIFIRYV